MSSDAEIRRAYREDRRHPYYSIQRGKLQRCISTSERRNEWTWGHFAAAMRKAFENPVRRAA